MTLDMRTIVLSHTLINFVLAFLLLFSWVQSNRRNRALLTWTLSYAFITAGDILMTLRGFLPDIVSIILANTLVFTGFFFLTLGISVFLDRKSPLVTGILAVSMAVISYCLFTFIFPSLRYRIITFSLVAVFFTLYNMILFLRYSPKELKMTSRLAAGINAGFTAINIARIVLTIIFQPGGDWMSSGSIESSFILVNTVLFTGFAFILFQLVNTKLQSALEDTARDLEYFATKDPLTGVFNRRKFTEMAEREFVRFKRYKQVCTLIVVDIDNLKPVNDTQGHLAGDQVLLRFSSIVRRNLRESDFFGRFGGDEFYLLLIETGKTDAAKIMERIRDECGKESIAYKDVTLNFTISGGIAEFREEDLTLDDPFAAADKALYTAKESGKNRIITA